MIQNWTNYFFRTNFSAHAQALAAIEAAEEIPADQRLALVSILSETDRGEGKELWLTGGPDKEWNLDVASVTYNGPNSPDFATNSKYSHVLILSFSEESVKPIGKLYLQYNLEA